MTKIADELLKRFPDRCKFLNIKLLHTRVVWNYIMRIEKAHKEAGKSKIRFDCGRQDEPTGND